MKKTRVCINCGKTFSAKQSLSLHRRTFHVEAVQEELRARSHCKCLEKDCSYLTDTVKSLRNHLELKHQISFPVEVKSFDTLKEFDDWKIILEESQNLKFSKRSANSKGEKSSNKRNESIQLFYCNRTYNANCRKKSTPPSEKEPSSHQKGKRKSVKMDTICTSMIKIIECLNTGKIQAEVCLEHYGHELETPDPKLIAKRKSKQIKNQKYQKRKQEKIKASQELDTRHQEEDELIDVESIFPTPEIPSKRKKSSPETKHSNIKQNSSRGSGTDVSLKREMGRQRKKEVLRTLKQLHRTVFDFPSEHVSWRIASFVQDFAGALEDELAAEQLANIQGVPVKYSTVNCGR